MIARATKGWPSHEVSLEETFFYGQNEAKHLISLSVLLLNCSKWLKKSAILPSQIDYCLALKEETKKWKFLEIVFEQILLLPILNLFLP